MTVPMNRGEFEIAHAMNSGLTTLGGALAMAGISHEIEQTGGNVLVLVININDDEILAVTDELEDAEWASDQQYFAQRMPVGVWREGEHDGQTIEDFQVPFLENGMTALDIIRLVRAEQSADGMETVSMIIGTDNEGESK